MPDQIKEVAKSLAATIHYSMSWNEPMSKNRIKKLTEELRKELFELNGVEEGDNA